MINDAGALYERFRELTGDAVAASNLTLAHAILQQTIETNRASYTVAEAACVLQVSEKTVYRLIREGQIAHQKVGSQIRIPPSELATSVRKPDRVGLAQGRKHLRLKDGP